MYFFQTSSVTLPLVATQYPRDQRCCPQYRLRSAGCSAAIYGNFFLSDTAPHEIQKDGEGSRATYERDPGLLHRRGSSSHGSEQSPARAPLSEHRHPQSISGIDTWLPIRDDTYSPISYDFPTLPSASFGCYCIPSPEGEGFTDPQKGTLKFGF